ncbi:MAG: VTT domain-containing protein [Bacilli bacterium]|nr:VTT domain-containing protein [Bacilli bacterium]
MFLHVRRDNVVIVDFILHCDEYIGQFINDYGLFVYAILFLVIFIETGLVVMPFLPGDSLIFAAGTFAGMGELSFWTLLILLVSAAVIGDVVNYEIGKHFGRKLLNNKKFVIVKQENLDKADALIDKYGSFAVFIKRFMPIIRTIVPFVVGMGKLDYKKFMIYNALGGICWVVLFLCLGFFFGSIPVVADNFTIVVLGIVFLSLLPVIYVFLKERFSKKNSS